MTFQSTSGSQKWEKEIKHTRIEGLVTSDVVLSPIETLQSFYPLQKVDILFFDPPGVDPKWTQDTYRDWFKFRAMPAIDSFAKKDAVLILVPRDRKGGEWLKSIASVSVVLDWGWKLFRQVMWKRQDADYNRSRYAFGNIFFFRRGNRPVNDDSSIRYKDIVYVKDVPKEGMGGELPVELVKMCLSLFAKRGDVVMDPFAGTGAIAVGASQLELENISVEIDEENYHNIIKRLEGLYL